MKVYVSKKYNSRGKYHTNKDCTYLPDNNKPVELEQVQDRADLCKESDNGRRRKSDQTEGECLYCGEEFQDSLPEHLRRECEGV